VIEGGGGRQSPPPGIGAAVFGPTAWADYLVYATHRIVEDSTMDTRRSRHPSRSDAIATFRWLGWVMLMMFVLVQTAHAARAQVGAAEAQKWRTECCSNMEDANTP
jgi:hypothetical protein